MSSNTPNLGLLKKDPMVDGNETFNIETMLNENWDKIDEAVGNVQVEIPDSSTTQKGIVQLSNATDGTRENVAATEKAVKDAALQAKSYTDQQISLVTETGIPKLVSYPLLVTATADNQRVFEIPLDLFDANTDTLLVAINRAALDPTQYTVTNTARNEAGEVTQRAKITLLSGVTSTSELAMVVLKNVPLGEDGAINGAVLAVDSIPINRVNGLQDQLREAFQAGNERKAEVVAALVAIGVPATTGETWAQLIPKIAAVIRATGNATAADILAGKTASNVNGPITGTMPHLTGNRAATGTSQWPDGSLAVYPEKGYQKGGPGDGEIKVTTAQLQTAEPNLSPGNILRGKKIYGVDGTLSPGGRAIVNNNPPEKNIPSQNTWLITDLFVIPSSGSYVDVFTTKGNTVNKIEVYTTTDNYSTTKTAALVLIDEAGVMHTLVTVSSGGADVSRNLTGFQIDRKGRTGIMYSRPWGSGVDPDVTPIPQIPANFNLLGQLRFCAAHMYSGSDIRPIGRSYARDLVVVTT